MWQVDAHCIVNALVPFSTRLADDGLVHVRAWRTSGRPVIVVAELDWAILTGRTEDAYYGPGIFTYPQYALPAALGVCERAGVGDGEVIVRLPAPPGERFARVTDPDDPQGWEPVEAREIGAVVGSHHWPGPPPGQYVRRSVEMWIASGVPPNA